MKLSLVRSPPETPEGQTPAEAAGARRGASEPGPSGRRLARPVSTASSPDGPTSSGRSGTHRGFPRLDRTPARAIVRGLRPPRGDGAPVLGFTWYSLVDQIDWDLNLREKRDVPNSCGLYDLQRHPRPVAAEYRSLLQEFGQITVLPHGETFAVTEEPARLKVEV